MEIQHTRIKKGSTASIVTPAQMTYMMLTKDCIAAPQLGILMAEVRQLGDLFMPVTKVSNPANLVLTCPKFFIKCSSLTLQIT